MFSIRQFGTRLYIETNNSNGVRIVNITTSNILTVYCHIETFKNALGPLLVGILTE